MRVEGQVGIITSIKPAAELGSKGMYPVAIIEHEWEGGSANAWICVPEGQDFEIGEKVQMFKEIEGHLTVLSFEKASYDLNL